MLRVRMGHDVSLTGHDQFVPDGRDSRSIRANRQAHPVRAASRPAPIRRAIPTRPATVDIDVWTLRDLMRSATIAAEPRRREPLTATCDLCTAPLAEGQDYEWIQPHRETVRRWATEAHLMLADDLLDSDPQAASDLLDKAIGLDRYNEALYVKAMHARHALTDADGIRTLLRALTKALADLDAEPREDTIELANKLRTSLDKK
jgi:hypothetical protein